MRRAILFLCQPCILLIAVFGARADDDVLATLQRQLHDRDHAAALATARHAVAIHTELPALWYNLAGLEHMHGHTDQALAALDRAVLMGFDDFRYADRDDDLGSLREHARYRQLRDAWAAGLAAIRAQRSLALDAGRWSPWFPLPDRRGAIDADCRVLVDVDGLRMELRLDVADMPSRPPWQPGGGGLLVSLAIPEHPTTGESRKFVDVGFGWQQGQPMGAVRRGDRWLPLAELAPKARSAQDSPGLALEVRIPWQACDSLHPLIDQELGFNASYRLPGDRQVATASLVNDPGLGRSDRNWRRGVPLTVTWSDQSPALQARIDDPLVRDGTFSATICALLPDDGQPGQAQVVLRGQDQDVHHDQMVTLERAGGRHLASIELTAPEPAGSATLGVRLVTGNAQESDAWLSTLAVVPTGWEPSTIARIDSAPAAERASLRYRYNAITAAMASRLALDDVGALATTLDELEALLARVDTTGSALPDSGPFLAVLPSDPTDGPLACSLALPPGWRRGQATPTLLMLARAPGAEQRAVDRVHRFLASRQTGPGPIPLVLAVPHLPAAHDPATARRQVERLLPWLREFLGCGDIHVAAVDLLAATVLDIATDEAHALAGILLLTGVNFAPYPDDDPQAIARRMSALPTDLPVGWIWFPDEVRANDQAATFRRALRQTGRRLEPALAVPGGLGFDQAWTRAVSWAAGLE